MQARYRLLRQVFRRGWYAVVAVEDVPSNPGICEVSEAAFAWLREMYPDAEFDSRWHADLREAAADGVTYALRDVPAPVGVRVVEIRFTDVDTTPECVKFAAAMATWDLVGIQPKIPPSLKVDGFHFPGAG